MVNLPYHRALIWLYVEKHDDHHIAQQLDELTLPEPESDVLEEFKGLASELPISTGTRRRLEAKRYDENDEKLFEKLEVGEIYLKHVGRPCEAWSEVHRLLRNPVCRVAVDVGLLCKLSPDDLSQMVPVAFNEPLTQQGIELYSKYFFDVRKMNKLDWRAYLKLCSGIPYLYVRYHSALTKSKREAMYLCGLPSKTAFSSFLRTVLGTAEYKFEYYSRHNNPGSDGQARAWAKVGFDAGIRYEKFSAADVTDFARSVQTAFEFEESEIETIDSNLLSEIKPPEVDIKDVQTKAPAIPTLFPDNEV